MGGHEPPGNSGGTFTDVCLFDEQSGLVAMWNVSSTPDDPSGGGSRRGWRRCRACRHRPGRDRLPRRLASPGPPDYHSNKAPRSGPGHLERRTWKPSTMSSSAPDRPAASSRTD
ncbi:MAG: hypothetical protein HIU82_14015 [Proteobacteria bacterium]|nr:hypothetical protein [Pseudomonadota bacterium]